MVIVLSVGNDQLLSHFDFEFLLFKLHVHLLQHLVNWFLEFIDWLVDKVWESYKRLVDEALLKEVVFKLAATHQEPFQDQEESLAGVSLVQISLKSPEESMANNPRVF